eukprot:gene10568-12223_t
MANGTLCMLPQIKRTPMRSLTADDVVYLKMERSKMDQYAKWSKDPVFNGPDLLHKQGPRRMDGDIGIILEAQKRKQIDMRGDQWGGDKSSPHIKKLTKRQTDTEGIFKLLPKHAVMPLEQLGTSKPSDIGLKPLGAKSGPSCKASSDALPQLCKGSQLPPCRMPKAEVLPVLPKLV